MNASLENSMRTFIDSMLKDVLENLKQDHKFEEKYNWMIEQLQIFEKLTGEEGEEPLVFTAELKERLHKFIEIVWELGSVINRAAYAQGLGDGIQMMPLMKKDE